MSNFINPLLVDGYIDDTMQKSVQGAYVGTYSIPQEDYVDKVLKIEGKIAWFKRELEKANLQENERRAEYYASQLKELEKKLLMIKL